MAWLSANHPAGLETLYACGQLGAIWVPVNARLSAPEARYILEHSGGTVVVHGREQAALAGSLRPQLPGVRAWVAVEEARDCLPYESLLAAADPQPRDEPVSLDDPCLIMYTSGTTGRPKGAVLTHGNMTWACINQILGFDIALDERTLALGPLFHIGGLNGTVNPTLLRGGCVVMVRSFDPAGTLAVIASQQVASFFAVPTMLDAMARDPGFTTQDLSSLRTVAAAGALLPLPTLRVWLDRGVTVQQAYGMTEAAPSGTVLESADATRHVGSAGRPQFFTDVRVTRPDGTQTAPGEVGEVVLAGPNVTAGYWNDPTQTSEGLRDGWYHSGDAGAVDEDGYLYVRDRYQDLIISGGENVYPAEVESALLELPGIVEAAVVGVPDEKWGEVGLALLVGVERPAEEIRLSLRQHLAGFKIPRYVRFRRRSSQDFHRQDPQVRTAPRRGGHAAAPVRSLWPVRPGQLPGLTSTPIRRPSTRHNSFGLWPGSPRSTPPGPSASRPRG